MFQKHGVKSLFNMSPRVFVVVLNWNGKQFLKRCLNSLLESSYRAQIIVVDNGSSDGSIEFIEKYFPKITLLKNKKNLGWTGGNNVGVRYAIKKNADAILILNNDTHVAKNAIQLLVNKLFSDKKIGIVGPKIYFDKQGDKKIISFAGGFFTKNRYFGMHRGSNEVDKGQYSSDESSEFITGAAIMIKRDVFKKIGLFDDDYFIYYDEADFCMRARQEGYIIEFVSQAHVFHAFSGTISLGSPFQHYYTTRNHYLFVEKRAPFSVKLREWLRTPKTIWEFMNSENAHHKKYSLLGIRDYYLRRFGKRVYW